MFKCNECGTEYEIKPDFCDCGNDTFTEVEGSIKPTDIQKEIPHNDTHKTTSKITFEEQYPEFERLKHFFDPISTAIFMICIVSGLLVVFLVGNPTKEKTPVKKETSKVVTEIPSIDSIWNNSTVGIINNEKTAQRTVQQTTPTLAEKPVQQVQTQQPINPMQLKVQNEINTPTPVQLGKSTQKNTTQPITKPQTTQQKPQQVQQPKPVTTVTNTPKTNQPITQTTTTKPNIPKNTQAAANQPRVQTQQTAPQNVTTQQAQTQQTKPKTTNTSQVQTNKPATTQVPVQTTLRPKATIDTQALQKELNNYKIGLRNTIGRKIDFANVIGDGDCVISFNIASNGTLTNRKFAKQSSNPTLNDAVYRAVMATPSYNPPPSGYNNETMNLKIRFYNGNFDISLN